MRVDVRERLEELGVALEKPLGRGAFAEVWRVRYRGVVRALRVSSHPVDDSPQGRIVERERETLRQIVALPELCNTSGFIEEIPLPLDAGEFFATVWQVATTNLAEWWRQNESPAKHEQLMAYLEQVARHLDLLRTFGFHHRDVKAENILVDGERARLCDLGLARQVGASTYCGTLVGTPGHMPPEMMERGESSPTHDLYGLAATYLALKTNLRPAEFLAQRDKQLSLAGLHAGESQVLAAALHPNPSHRYQDSAVAWVRWLAAARTNEAPRSSPNAAWQRVRGVVAHFFLTLLWSSELSRETVDA